MKKVLIFCAGKQGAQEGLQIDEAIEQFKKGNEVHFLYCDHNVGGCNDNPWFNSIQCKTCKIIRRQTRNAYLPKGIIQHSIDNIIDQSIIKQSNISFSYETTENLRDIKFHGVEIGSGALSSYVSFTRNLNPTIDTQLRLYFDKLLRSQVLLTLVIEKLHKEFNFDLFVFHNGRFAIFKPLLNLAELNKIDYICTECYVDKNGNYGKDYFYNDIPHNIGPNHKKFMQEWDDAYNKGIDREAIGKSFFERRRNAQGTGDKIYTAGQNKTKFVDDWNEDKENIIIFNSSEDEFFAVSGDFEKGKVFKSQLEGIKTIVNHYINDKNKHFYLRVHPNLMNVNYSYHLDIYKLDYPNLTVIPADSPISSYVLLDKADKVITFGSTMGIEATYARKPSISLGPTVYDMLNVVYKPKTMDELWEYIEKNGLKDLYSTNVLIYGYYLMGRYNSSIRNKFKNIDFRRISYNILGKKRIMMAYEKIMKSNIVFLFVRFILNFYESVAKRIKK